MWLNLDFESNKMKRKIVKMKSIAINTKSF